MADNNIKVVIKVRPLIKREIDDSLQKQWTVSDNTIYPTAGREGMGEFTFGTLNGLCFLTYYYQVSFLC